MIKTSKFKPGDIVVSKSKKNNLQIGMIQRINFRNEFYTIYWIKGNYPKQVLQSPWYAIDNYFDLKEEPNKILKEIL